MIEDAASVEAKIVMAISSSSIDVLKRLEPGQRDNLGRQIAQTVRKANLVGTQLDAFLGALSVAVHCTQGPPGTGKVSFTTFVLLFVCSNGVYVYMWW
jgi:hypothetical protein